MKCMVKIMAMPATKAAGAELCMFELAACDDGGPGFVHASVRMMTNARPRRGAVAKQIQRYASTCLGRCRRHDRKEGANGNVGVRSRQSSRRTTEKKDKQELEMHEQRRIAEDANKIRFIIHANAENEGVESRGSRDEETHASRRA